MYLTLAFISFADIGRIVAEDVIMLMGRHLGRVGARPLGDKEQSLVCNVVTKSCAYDDGLHVLVCSHAPHR